MIEADEVMFRGITHNSSIEEGVQAFMDLM